MNWSEIVFNFTNSLRHLHRKQFLEIGSYNVVFKLFRQDISEMSNVNPIAMGAKIILKSQLKIMFDTNSTILSSLLLFQRECEK